MLEHLLESRVGVHFFDLVRQIFQGDLSHIVRKGRLDELKKREIVETLVEVGVVASAGNVAYELDFEQVLDEREHLVHPVFVFFGVLAVEVLEPEAAPALEPLVSVAHTWSMLPCEMSQSEVFKRVDQTAHANEVAVEANLLGPPRQVNLHVQIPKHQLEVVVDHPVSLLVLDVGVLTIAPALSGIFDPTCEVDRVEGLVVVAAGGEVGVVLECLFVNVEQFVVLRFLIEKIEDFPFAQNCESGQRTWKSKTFADWKSSPCRRICIAFWAALSLFRRSIGTVCPGISRTWRSAD